MCVTLYNLPGYFIHCLTRKWDVLYVKILANGVLLKHMHFFRYKNVPRLIIEHI